jgi:hypothetical protein
MASLLILDAHSFNSKTKKGDIRLTLEEDDTKFYLGGSCLLSKAPTTTHLTLMPLLVLGSDSIHFITSIFC